jgi:hypothetical protein
MTLSAIPSHSSAVSGISPEVEKEILRIVAGIEYGSVEILIHGGQVVQIEARRKTRYDGAGKAAR